MSDIVEELRQASLNQSDYRWEAADEIERLRAALKKINVGDGWAALIARAALSGDKHD